MLKYVLPKTMLLNPVNWLLAWMATTIPVMPVTFMSNFTCIIGVTYYLLVEGKCKSHFEVKALYVYYTVEGISGHPNNSSSLVLLVVTLF